MPAALAKSIIGDEALAFSPKLSHLIYVSQFYSPKQTVESGCRFALYTLQAKIQPRRHPGRDQS